MNKYQERIEQLRAMMRSKGWDAVIVTGADPHESEFPAERWKQVEWLTGFTGEAGDVVVTLDHAGLWTDTRYFIQAVQQLEGTGVVLHKTRVPEQVLIPEWLDGALDEEDAVVAVDGLCQSADAIKALPSRFAVVSVPDMLEPLWPDRIGIPCTPVFEVQTGESRESKLRWLRETIAEKGCGSILLTALDDIAWVLNVRASDIEYNPFVISYLLVDRDGARWFVHDNDLDLPDVEILPYEDVEMALSDIEGRLFVDTSTLNYHLLSILEQCGVDLFCGDSPVQLRKSVKNPVEIERMRAIHIQDGVAMEKFLYWLEKSLDADRRVTEWDAALKLGQYRSEIDGYMGDSFETISAYGKSAALPHYITPRHDAPVLEDHGLYLCDAGGQFESGTTDITRTVPLGECTRLEMEDYTLVLKGHIDLAMAVFPAGTAGCQLDALARAPLWSSKRNFGHGTGHGVGFFLGVHEGPQDIRQNFNRTPLLPGMITSDEPGIYREGLHGVRHENLILCVEAGKNDFGRWLAFEPLTLCHFDTSVLLAEMLTDAERQWLNDYHRKVYDTLAPLLPQEVAQWLKLKTAEI